MKKLIILIPILAGCHSISVTTPGGATAKVTSFGQRTTIGSLSFNTNGISVLNYNNDQYSALAAAFAFGQQMGAKLATSGLAP